MLSIKIIFENIDISGRKNSLKKEKKKEKNLIFRPTPEVYPLGALAEPGRQRKRKVREGVE